MPLMWQDVLAADGVVPRLPPQPREIRPAQGGGLQRGLGAAGGPARAGRARSCRSTASEAAHLLLDVPPMSDRRRSRRARRPRRRAPPPGRHAGAHATGRASRSWRRRRSSSSSCTASSRSRPRSCDDPAGPPRVPEAHGRLAGPGRPHRLHAAARGEDRSLREGARGAGPGQAALLRHRAARRRLREGRPRREPRGPARPRSRATRTIPPASAPPTCSARPDPRPLRPRPLADPHATCGEIRTWDRLHWPRMRAALDAQRARAGRGPAHPHRDRHLADAGRADRRRSSRDFPAAKWHQWEPRRRPQPCARARCSPSAAPSTRATDFDAGGRGPLPRRRLRRRRARPASATSATSPRAPAERRAHGR